MVIFTLACTEKETKRARKYEHTVYILTSLLLSHHLKEKCAVQYIDSKKKRLNLLNNSQIPCIKDMFKRLSKKINNICLIL